MPENYEVAVNANHPMVQKLLNESDAAEQAKLAKRAGNLARLSQGLLEGAELTSFITEGYSELS